MQIFDVFTLLLIFAAFFSYLNTRFKAMPPAVGFMVGALLVSLILIGLDFFGFTFAEQAIEIVGGVDFEQTVLYGILSFLLFAGSLQLEISDLSKEKWVIFTLATFGVVLSTFIVGTLMFWVFAFLEINMPYLYALIFGALISPTDPVAVIGMLKESKMSKSLKMQVIGESLFNDGIAITAFIILIALAKFQLELSFGAIMSTVFIQIVGSVAFGLALGWLLHKVVMDVNNANTGILITLGFVAGGYDLAIYLGVSAPITVVVTGLFFRNYRMHKDNLKPLYDFWTLLDEFLNALLFILMGLEILSLTFTGLQVLAGCIAVGVVLVGRYVSVWIPIHSFKYFRKISKNATFFLTWAGLRGGISLAMALALPDSSVSNAIRCSTYIVVLFSTLVQGLTLKSTIVDQE